MATSDAVVSNLTLIYVAVIALVKAYGLMFGRSFGGGFVLAASTVAVGIILVSTLAWDVSQKAATPVITRDHRGREACIGGICWHGVAVKSPASQFRFRLPQQRLLDVASVKGLTAHTHLWCFWFAE